MFDINQIGLPTANGVNWLNRHKWSRRGIGEEANYENDLQFTDILINLADQWQDLFTWDNLPETCNERVLERTLYYYGKAAFVVDRRTGSLMHFPCTFEGPFNAYYEPKTVFCFSNEYQERYPYKDCVIVRNTRNMYPSFYTAEIYAKKLFDAARSIDVLARKMKVPYIFRIPATMKSAAEEMIKNIDTNVVAHFLATDNGGEDLTQIDTLDSFYTSGALAELWDHYNRTLCEWLTRIGHDNNSVDKKERVLGAEVESQEENTNSQLDILYRPRKEAAEGTTSEEGINDKFAEFLTDGDVSVHPTNEDYEEDEDDSLLLGQEAGRSV